MAHHTYIPCDALKPYISALAISEGGAGSTYKVLPGTGLVLGFQYSGRVAHIAGGSEMKLSTAGITGLHGGYRVYKSDAGTGTLLVYFRDGGAAAFFSYPLHELFGESVSLEQFMLRSELLVLEEQLLEAPTHTAKIQVAEQFLTGRLQHTAPDALAMAAVAIIHRCKGNIRIKDLALQLHTSASPLEKRFRQAIGTSPKKFASIVRMKHAIAAYTPGTPLTALGYHSGFYDQAHFIKEFRSFTGDAPEAFFKTGE